MLLKDALQDEQKTAVALQMLVRVQQSEHTVEHLDGVLFLVVLLVLLPLAHQRQVLGEQRVELVQAFVDSLERCWTGRKTM